ncbi:FprA family A-type flavoprotein [Comamonadaceae bacterium OH2545_COT-014]|nr:FprA family A-type flavoprotein [Comamonadaceae bacterium OH2545_COT-014]
MTTQLYAKNGHECLMFHDLVEEGHEVVQSNQFIICHDEHMAVIDPGGVITYNTIFMRRMKHFPQSKVEYIMASHADPDVVASLNKWLVQTSCRLVIPALWSRFVPHFCTQSIEDRLIAVPDRGGLLPLGSSWIIVLPAHFLHSEGNFQFYDPVSRILFSGDLGASLVSNRQAGRPVSNFDEHVPRMIGFHRRYMSSRKVCQYWAHMVRELDIDMIVPQHGSFFVGKPMVNRLIDWIERQDCGLDLLTQAHYSLPRTKLL